MNVLAVLMVAVMIWGWLADRRGEPAGRAILAGGALGLMAVALGMVIRGSGPEDLRLEAKEEAWAEVRGWVLGRHLGETYAGEQTLVILPFDKSVRPWLRDAEIRGITAGFTEADHPIETLDPPLPGALDALDPTDASNEDFDTAPAVDDWYDAEYLDTLLRDKGRGFDLVVCLPGLPWNADEMILWRQGVRPKIAIGSVRRDVENTLLKSGRLAAAIGAINGDRFDGSFPDDDPAEAFATRYRMLGRDAPEPTDTP
ncbi:MAG: hypothetical protein ACYTGQ_06185 [Planctomycetota bacterium]|jgi:hypothetical protein